MIDYTIQLPEEYHDNSYKVVIDDRNQGVWKGRDIIGHMVCNVIGILEEMKITNYAVSSFAKTFGEHKVYVRKL